MIGNLTQVFFMMFVLSGMIVVSGIVLITIMVIVVTVTGDKCYFKKKIEKISR